MTTNILNGLNSGMTDEQLSEAIYRGGNFFAPRLIKTMWDCIDAYYKNDVPRHQLTRIRNQLAAYMRSRAEMNATHLRKAIKLFEEFERFKTEWSAVRSLEEKRAFYERDENFKLQLEAQRYAQSIAAMQPAPPFNAEAFISDLTKRGVRLSVSADGNRITAIPAALLTESDLQKLKTFKTETIAALSNAQIVA